MKSTVHVGIIGLGAIGNVHIDALKNVPNARVTAICDANPEVVEAAKASRGIDRAFTDYRKMLKEKDLDAVYVCTPNFLHCEAAVASLKAGKHVFCEKPMALNARQAKKMVDAARAKRKVLQMGMAWRSGAEAQTIKSFIDNGYLGNVYHMRVCLVRRRGIPGLGGWFTTKSKSGGGGLIDIGVHFLDLVMWLTGQWKPQRVSAALYAEFGRRMRDYVYTGMWAGPPRFNGTFDVDDYASGLVRFPKNVTLAFEIAWAANAKGGNVVEILGDKGGVRGFDGNPPVIYTEQNGRLVDLAPQFANCNNYEVQSVRFIDAIRGKGTPAATGEEGLIVMKLLDAIHKSSKMGREVTIG